MSFARVTKESVKQLFRYPKLQLSAVDYDTYWKQKRDSANLGALTPFQRQRVDWITPKIEPNASILDIGCGDGGVLLELKRRLGVKAIGTDISNYTLDFLSTQGITALNIDTQDIAALDQLEAVDHVILFEILEHSQNPERLLLTALEKAKKSVFFSFPNTGFLPYRLRLLMGRFPVQWKVHPGEHLRYWTLQDLRWWLRELGLEKRANIHVYEGFPILNRISPSLFGMGFVGEIGR